MAFDYAAAYDGYWRNEQHRAVQGFVDADTLAQEILLSCAGRKVLDIGAGMGRLVHALLRLGVDARGVDVAAVAVERAAPQGSGRFVVGSVLALPYADDAFDTLVATNMLECLAEADLDLALAEMRRVGRGAIFLRIATGGGPDATLPRICQPRRWWEERLFAAGFRKHPAYYQVNDYEALQHDGDYLTIIVERLPAPAAALYPLSALVEERDLHMDMLRESGSRSDAHVARYQWATQYIRPGDTVLDAACGLGYGSYVLQSGSTAASTLGIDGSDYAYAYAEANFAAHQAGLAFRCGMLPEALAIIPDHSVDVVISFETLEHIDANLATLAEFHRILTPGGRLITSVPNDWSDASGEDPNPFHVHVYTLERLCAELETHFIVEELVAQTADQYKSGADRITWHPAGRRLQSVSLDMRGAATTPPAEWWLAVAMRSPLEGRDVPYRETAYPTFDAPAWHVTTYARDYQNPWLVRSMVDTGHRLRHPAALRDVAEAVTRTGAAGSPDVGAALCVLAYQLLACEAVSAGQILALQERIDGYFAAGPQTMHGVRWQVSLWFVLGRLWLEQGDFARARDALERCAAIDAMAFSPLLCNRSVEAHLLLGSLAISAGDAVSAERHWRAGIAVAHGAVAGDWTAALGSLNHPAEFGLPEMASILDYASACAFALAHRGEIDEKYWWWLHPRRDRASQARRAEKELQHARLALRATQHELQNYAEQAVVFSTQAQHSQAELAAMHGLAASNGAELAAYRTQADEYAHQVRVLQATAARQESELIAYRAQAAEFASQVSALQRSNGAMQEEITAARADATHVQALEQVARRELGALRHEVAVAGEQADEQLRTVHQHLANYRATLSQREEELAVSRAQAADLLLQHTSVSALRSCQDAELDERARRLDIARHQHAAMQAALDEAAQKLAAQEHIVSAMQQSNSWRLTRPLRVLMGLMKRRV